MNTPLRRVGLAMLAMIILLLANATYIQIVNADDYRKDARNQRVLLEEYARQRGQIVSQFTGPEQVIANVVATNDRLRYLRRYSNGPMYAPVTGFYSVRYGATGLERAEDEILNGSDDRLFVRRLSDLITGRDPRGGNIRVTVHPAVQKAAYERMANLKGAVVALRPQTGEILAMVSTPSYDPNQLAQHDAKAQETAYEQVRDEKNPAKPLLNRAISENYFPGSTFKLVTAAAALEDGRNMDSPVQAAAGVDVISGQPCSPGENTPTCLGNYDRGSCAGSGSTVPLKTAIQKSCNTAFAQLAHELGEDKMRDQAAKLGIGDTELAIPMSVVPSCIGPRGAGCLNIVDDAALYQSGIGQKDVRLTPLENAVIAATIANGGERMRPQLVKQILAPDLDLISDFEEDRAGRAMSTQTAEQLKEMMLLSEQNTRGSLKNTDDKRLVASKTGTAETGELPKETPPFAWYVAFAPADNPKIAVAVVVETTELRATGGQVSADIGRATINAALAGGL